MAPYTLAPDGGSEQREAGVEFGDLADDLESEAYPLTLEELLSSHGDEELVLGDETTTLREVLEPLGEDEYESPEEVKEAVLGMVGDEAVGRKGYSDRGGESPGEDDDPDESF